MAETSNKIIIGIFPWDDKRVLQRFLECRCGCDFIIPFKKVDGELFLECGMCGERIYKRRSGGLQISILQPRENYLFLNFNETILYEKVSKLIT